MLEKMEFLQVIQKKKGSKDHNIEMVSDEWMAQIQPTTKHFAKIVNESMDRVYEEWDHYNLN